jgi:hypothetical protein
MRKGNNSTYALRRRGLPNFRNRALTRSELKSSPLASPAPILAVDSERQRLNFEQRRLEHLRERWRVQGPP